LAYAGAVVVATVVVTVGTDPFSIHHFHHVALYSPLTNVVVVPVSAVWTLPWGVVSCLLMPFGLERFALIPMGWGIDVTIRVAEAVSALPGNVRPMAAVDGAGSGSGCARRVVAVPVAAAVAALGRRRGTRYSGRFSPTPRAFRRLPA
jgi:predicted membrane metal-binding protein